MIEEINKLANALGYLSIPSKNVYMLSFRREEDGDKRINIYFTKMTVSVQSETTVAQYFYNVSLNELEDIFSNN